MHPIPSLRRCRPPAAAQLLILAAAASLAACGGDSRASIGGDVSGLNAGQNVTLQNNHADTLAVSANGPFRFGTELDGGTTYNVTILTQPQGQICEVANGTGSVDSNSDSIIAVTVACVTTSSVGGTVSGLAAGTSVTLSNGTVLLPLAANGPFTFPGTLAFGTDYDVTVATQPLGQTCRIANGVGSVTADSLTALAVTCS